ncbi:mucin-binding protein [Lactobacillus jensenii]|uniref:mucin-binding protein n=1 Tax=Lactobacillus jensenii TaxID=109790 RepID=UPI001248CD49|nr:LPXTG cell wall anchor domain-containing protein [Lactobacillus jensenii]KAA9265489.1 LPXTG cell wall anchor domain-containing protein [Lactobacillus jensenii]
MTQTVDETSASLKFEALPDTSVQAGDKSGWNIRGLYDNSSKTASGYSSYEPIIYYVLPKGITYRNTPGLGAGNFTAGGNTAIPKVSTFINSEGEQVIKVDYSGTKSYYTWPKDEDGINDQYDIGAVPGLDMIAGDYKGAVYIKSTTPMDTTLNPKATSDDAQKLLDLAGDATNLYHVSDLTFKVNSGDIVNTVTSAKVDNGAWKDIVKTDVNPNHFKDHTVSFGWTLNNQASDEVKGIVSVAEIPQINKHGNELDFQLSGPITLPSNLKGAKAYYYTGDFNMDNTEVSGKPDLSTWQTADQITDWSKVKYVAVSIDSLPAKSSSGRIEISGHITKARYSNAGTGFLPTITYTKKPDNSDNGPLSILTMTGADGRRRAAEVDATVVDSLDVKAVFPTDSGISDIDLGRGPVYTPNEGQIYSQSDYPDSMAEGKIPAGWKLDKKVLVDNNGQEYAWGRSVFYLISGEPNFTDLHVEFRYIHNQRTITPGDFPDKDKSAPIDGVTYRDVVKTVTRTIRVHKTDGTVETTTQPIDFYRTITYDEVDKKIISTSAYKPDDSLWAAYSVPSVPDKVTVYTKTINSKTTDPTILADGNVPEETIDATTNDEFVDVYYQDPGTKKPDVQKTVTRTVTVNFPTGYNVDATALKAHDGNGVTTTVNGQTVTRTYTTTMTRTVSLKSDGTWQTTDWQYTNQNWPGVTSGDDLLPAITKYTPTVTDNTKQQTIASINAEVVNENTQNESFTINYNENGVIQIVAVDKSDNNKPISLGDLSTTMEGQDGTTIDQTTLSGYINSIKQKLAGQNYKFDSQTPTANPTTYADQTVTLYFTHNTQSFTPENKPTDAEDLEKTISRTVTVNFPDEAHAQAFAGKAGYTVNGKSVTRTDTATFTRTATKDLVTNTYSYTPWVVKGTSQASATLPGLNYGEAFLPEIARYAPDRSSVNAVTIDDAYIKAGTTPESVTINYAPSSTTFQVVLEDQDDGNKVVKSFTFNNKVGETHTYTDAEKALPSNYEWADENNKLGDSITLSDTTPALTVYYVKHMHKTTTGTKDINRTIDGTKPDGSTINYSDKVTFNYTTDTDLVNGKTTTKYDHDSQSFNAVPDTVAPASIDGYSRVLNGGTLDSQAVTPNSSDINVHVSYIANDQKILIKAYDVHDNGKTELAIPRGIMTSIIGKSKAVVDTTEVQSAINAIKQYLESNGYTMITKNPVIPTNFDADSKVDQIVELDFDHKTDVIDHGHIPDGSPIKASDLETTVKRTVTVHNTDGSTQTVNQDFTATRTANYDPVTKKVISYNPWSGSSSTFTISPQKGYKSRWTTRFGEGTPISAKSGDTDYQLVPAYDVDAQHITADTVPGQNVDVYYDAQDATRTIKYQDKDTGKIVGSFDSDPGKVGTQVTVDIKGNVPDGYELTPGIEIPTQVDVTTDDVPVVVSVQRKGTTYSYTDKNLPTGVTADDLQKTVKRQIIEHLTTAGQDQDKYINQTANFVRTVTVYPATKDLPQKVVFGEWTPKTDADAVFSEKAIDQVDGYISVEVGSDTVTGHPITVVPSQVVQKSNGEPIDADTFHVYYRKVSTVPEGNIPEGTTKKDGTKLTDADLGTDIIRDIYETAPGTSEPKLVKVQKVRLTRDALVNQYTHEVLGYSDWRINSEYNKNHAADGYADTLPDYTPTAYTGYTPSVAEVTPIIQIDNNTPHLIHVYISYNNQKRTQVINYVDSATGKTVRTQTITGVSNQDSSENLEVPAGYEQDTTKKAENVTFSEDGQSIIAHFQDKDLPTGTIYVKAGQDTYTKDNVPENLRDQVVKEVTRTITVNRPGEKTPQVIKQTVIFHRTIKFDKVTGQVIPETATAWVTDDNSANGTWAEYDAPTIAGYVPTTATVASQSVTADTADANITINYTDNTQNIKLKAVDDTNNASEITIPSGYTTEISGTSSTPVDQDKLQGAIDKIVKALEDEGYKFAGNNTIDTYDNDKTTDQWITIHFTHQTEEDSKGQLPEGVTPEDLEKTITRTVHVKGEPTKGDHDETQTVTATRKAIYDKVAKKIIGYTDWTGAIPVFNIDQYTGYTSKVDGNAAKEVSSVTIDNNTPATLENTVTYEAGDATQIINYVTEDGTKVGTTSISGHVGDALGSGVVDKINGNVPSGYELVSGQNFTNYESNKFSTVDNPISVYVKGENGARAQIIFKDIETSREIGSARDVTGPSGETKEFDLTAPNGYDFVDPTDAKKNITFSTDGKTVIIPVYVKHHTDTIGPNDNPDDATKKLITQSLTGNATRTITVHKIDGSTTTETQTVQMHRSAIIDRATDTVTYTAWEADDPANAAFKEYTPAKQAGYTTLVDGAPKDTVASETPTKPGDETVNVTYKASQKSAEIRYVDSKTKQVVKTDAVTGAPGEKVTNFTTSVPDGYVLDDGQKVPSEVDIAAGDQATDPITVYVHQKIDTLTTDQAKTHGVLDSDLARTVARTVIINEPGKASQTYTQVAHFTRQAQLNEATGAITYTAWTSSDSHFDAISVPEVAGYKSTVAATDPSVGAIDVTAEDRDKFVVVNYTAGDQDLTIRLHDVTDSSKSVDIAVPSDVTSVFHGKSGAAIDSTDLRSAISKIKDELAKQGYQYVGEDMPVDYDTDDKVMQYLDMNFKRVSQTVGPHDTIPEGTKKDDGTDLSEKDLTQTVTRTIYTTDPEDNQTRFTQTVVVTRTATIDMNTKKVTGFSAWSSASFDQYTAPSYKNYTTNIDVDGSGNNVVGRAVTADEIASGQAKDVHITYTKNTQEATPTNIPDGAKKSDGSKLTKDDLEKSVTRTIHFVDENGNKVADDSVEKVTFTRTATLDKDGKVISYSDWTQSGSWDDVTSPEKAGFKATIATIPAVALTPETAKDVEITVTYKPERVIGHIKFVDDKTGALVSDKIVDAKAGQTGVATNAAVPEGYEIAADSEVKTVPASLDFGATDHDDVIIKVSQKVDDVDPDHIPDGVKKSDGTPLTKDDLEKTITRHIHFVYPTSYKGAKDDDFDQTVTIKRTAQYNEATKTVIFGDWQPATLEAYTPADREGLVTPSAVPSLTVDENSQDSSVTLTYTTKTASMNFKAYDDTEGKDITLPSTLQTSISHAGDQTVTQTEIDGVVEGIKSAVGDNYKFEKTETDENGNVVVHFTHKTSPVTPTDSDQATTKEITRIIHVTTPDGKTYNYKQTVTATRTLTRDLVTGKVTEGDWTTPSFDQYGAPQYDGYTSQVDSTNSTEVTAHQVTADEITAGKASDVNVTYQANDQSFKVHFIDAKTGQEVLSPVTYSGKTGENVTIDQSKWNLANYKLVPGQNIPASVKLSAEPSDLYVTVDHNTTQYDTKNPGKFNLSKTITRTIKVVDPVTGATSVVDAESVTFTRTATVDNVDGSVIYSDWTPTGDTTWADFIAPAKTGYTASPETINGKTVSAYDNDETDIITYTANNHDVIVKYVDSTGKEVGNKTISGKTGATIPVDAQSGLPDGYEIDPNKPAPATYTVGDGDGQTIEVHVITGTHTYHEGDSNVPSNIQLAKTVTRTINTISPDGTISTQKQSITFTRTATVNAASGKVTYSDWIASVSSASGKDVTVGPDGVKFSAVTPVEKTGYKTNIDGNLAEETITADSNDSVVNVTYTPEDQSVVVKAVDDDNHGSDITDLIKPAIAALSGKTDAAIDPAQITSAITAAKTALADKYDYVSFDPVTKFGESGQGQLVIHFKHKTETLDKDHTGAGTEDDFVKEVTRTIHLTDTTNATHDYVQHATVSRTATKDLVTGAVTYSDWSVAKFDEFDIPQVDGYKSYAGSTKGDQTTAATQVASADVTVSNNIPQNGTDVYVSYKGNENTNQSIEYVDIATGKTVKTDTVSGIVGQNTTYAGTLPKGYELANNSSIPTSVTITANNTPVKIYVRQITYTDANKPSDLTDALSETITRTIHFEGITHDDVVQSVSFTRTATYNPTTGKVTYGEWTPKDGESNTWASVTTPTIAGYIPTVSGFDAVTVTDRDVDEDLTVTYKPEVRNYKVNYVDQNGNVIKTDTVTGKTGDTVQINSSTPFGWNLDDGQTIPTTATLDADDTKNVATVHVHQVTKTIKGSDDTHNDALNKTVTRTVIITDTRGEQTKQVQSVHFTRNQEINLATGETHYTDWTADGDDKFDAVTAPTVDGYTIVGQAPEVDGVKATDPDTTVNISYVANKQTDTFKAVDDDQNGEPISLPGSFTTTLKGDSDTPITQDQVDSVIKDINDYLTEKGYVSKAAPTITTDEQGNKTITLHFGHGTEDTSATDPAAKKTVTRTIQFIGAGKQSPVVQTITATRTATKDTVTGETKYGDWTGSFDKYNAPVLDGYTMTIDGQDSTDGVVPSVNVDKKAPQNVTVTVVYTGKQGQQTVHYIDADTGKEVQVDNPQVIRATVGSTQEVNFTAPKGYDLIPGQKTSEEITIPATDTGIDVFVKQHVDNYDSKNNPDNLELTKDVTRTIIVNKPNEAPQSIKQTVHFTRTASVNAATGATTYSAWTVDGTDSWDAYTADDVNGYTTYVDGKEGKDVASQTVTAYTGNQTVNITYTANAKSVQIVYVDKTGKQLGSQTINGHTGSTENVTPVLPSGYQVPKDGKQVPTTITFPGDGSDLTNITITVEPTQHTYNPGDKDLDKEVSAEVRDKMFKTVTRTVNIYVPNEKGQEVKTTIVQEVHFARPVTVYGDGTVQYAKTWTPQGETKFDAINVDNFRGYDASVDGTTPSEQVPEVDNIPAETPDSTIDVHYLPQDQKVRFKVVDITDNKEITDLNITNDLESPVITGKSGTEIPTDKVKAYVDQIKKLMEARGYEFDSAIYPSDFDKDKSVDQQVILNFRHAKKNFEGTDTIPDNVKKGDNTALTKSDLTRDVTRKIILHTPNGDVEFTQHVTAPRTATVDEVTHVATLGDWTTPDFASQDVPSYRGYTAKIGDTTVTSVSSAPVAYVNDEPQNASDVVVDYVGQTGATQIDFVDKDGKIVGSSKSFEGQVGHDVTISGVTVPDGWKLAEGSTIPSSATVYADGRHVKVLVVHDTENVPSTKIPDGTTRSDGSKLTETDLKHDIVRKITLNKPAGTEVVIQHVVWSREAIVDKVTHQVVGYTDWTLNTQTPTESQDGKTTTQYGPTWKPIHTDAIKVAGYTPTTDQVTEVTPGPNANNDEITINYVAQPATVKVIYHDDKDNKDVAFDTIIGKKDGSKSTYDYQVPNGYQLAGDKTSAEFSFDGEDHYLVDGGQAIDAKTPFIIHLTHKTETFDKTSHAGFDDSDFERTVERHVRIHIPEHLEDPSVLGSFLQPGQTFEVVQSVTYERTATKDDATGKIIFSDWTIADTSGNVTENDDGSVDFKAVEAGQLAGYTPMTSAQEVAKVTADSRVSDLDIYYVENGTTITISARDNDTKSYLTIPDELQTTLTFPDVTGKDQGQKSLQSDVTAITAYFEKKGYDYVDVTQDGNHYTINFKHHIDHFTGDTCPDIPSDLDSAIKQPLTADVHREIEVHLPGQTDPVIITQTVHAHRTVSVDRAKLAKGDADAVKYDDWVFDDGDKFKAMPEAIQGYKTLINGVEAKDKNGTVPEASAKDKGGNPADGQKVVVTYQADVANAQIHYIDTDDGNKEIGTAQEVSGHSDEQKTVDTKLPDGYEYVDPSQKQVTIKFSDDGSVVSVNVLLKHKKVTTDKVPEGIKKQDGTDLTDADLTKTVTRTFDVLAPEGSKVDVPDKQTVTYKRSVTYDPVTKTVQSFGDWTAEGTDTWSQVDVPQVKGYTSVVDGTPSQVVAKVDKPQSDVTVKITYKAGQQQIRVIAVDDKTGAPIIIPVDGQALQTIIYGQTKAIVDKAQAQSYIEAIIYRLTKLGWIYDGHTEVPTLFDDDSSKDQNIVIGFHAEIDDYKPNDKLPDGAKDPNNKADQIVREMTKTRTIIFKDEKENVTKKVEQKVDFVRDVFINKVTNQVDHYGDWQYKDSNVKTWDAYDINKPGYTATVIDTTDIKNPKPLAKSEIDKQVVDDKSSDIELTVTYTKNPVKEDSGNNHGGNTSSGENGHKSGNTPEISNGKGVKTTLRGIKTPKRATLRSSNLVGKNARKLPQTGSDKEASAALGLAALGMSSALAYASKRKKRRN